MLNETNFVEKNIIEIAKSRARYSRHHIVLEDEKRIDDLLFEDLVYRVKQNISRYDIIPEFIASAQRYLALGSKSHKGDKDAYNFIVKILVDDFFVKPIILKEIRYCGFEDYAVEFFVEVDHKNMMISIPLMKNITVKNFEAAYEGVISLFEVDDSHEERVAASYNPKDIRNYMEVKKEENDQNYFSREKDISHDL